MILAPAIIVGNLIANRLRAMILLVEQPLKDVLWRPHLHGAENALTLVQEGGPLTFVQLDLQQVSEVEHAPSGLRDPVVLVPPNKICLPSISSPSGATC